MSVSCSQLNAYCPGIDALVIIVVSLSCTAYLWGSLIVFCHYILFFIRPSCTSTLFVFGLPAAFYYSHSPPLLCICAEDKQRGNTNNIASLFPFYCRFSPPLLCICAEARQRGNTNNIVSPFPFYCRHSPPLLCVCAEIGSVATTLYHPFHFIAASHRRCCVFVRKECRYLNNKTKIYLPLHNTIYNTIKDPHWYAVQESDTTMMTRAS